MPHTIVKILRDDDGVKIEKPVWHLSIGCVDGNRRFCGGKVYGPGESRVAYKEKTVTKGGITCHICLSQIAEIKAIIL